MPRPTVAELIRFLNLQSHPEGGYYAETYRAAGSIPRGVLLGGFHGDRNHSTGIYYLLPAGAKSRLHRLVPDEMMHFYLGDPLTLVIIDPQGRVEETVLGSDLSRGHQLQKVIPGGSWFGLYPNPGTEYGLLGCTVAPGFDFADFEVGERQALLQAFPKAQEIILKLTD